MLVRSDGHSLIVVRHFQAYNDAPAFRQSYVLNSRPLFSGHGVCSYRSVGKFIGGSGEAADNERPQQTQGDFEQTTANHEGRKTVCSTAADVVDY